MEYKGIRYTVRIGTERGRWAVAIHPAGVESSARFCFGCRDEAERQARAMIDSGTGGYSRGNQLLALTASSEGTLFIERSPAIGLDACSISSLGGE
jgi:hypothetical protein